ncbi:WD40 repeat domain-containing protein [Deinococcus taklimakanensis]|uniref:WD40 repeat domain-containing protein n=1 Tax=Deinococcus taklimakanensis TaxID=536443 RepID=A0ABW5NZ29_9DEIO
MSHKTRAAVAAAGLVAGFLGGAQAQAAPPAGTYACLTLTLTLVNQVQYNPFSYTANSNGFELALAPVPLPVPSPLGDFTLDGKGKYTHSGPDGKPLAGGTYTVDRAGKVKFAGSLADTSKSKLSGYKVGKSGPVFTFDIPELPTECTLKKGAQGAANPGTAASGGNSGSNQVAQGAAQAPAPGKPAVPNPELSGVLTISVGGKAYDIDARTGKTVWSSDGDGLQRLPGGLMAYALSDQLVIAKDQGQVLTRVNGLYWKEGTGETEALLSLNPDGTRLLVATQPSKGSFSPANWRLLAPNGQELARFPESQGSFYFTLPRDLPAFLPDGRILIPNPEDKLLYVYDAKLNKQGLFVQEPSNTPVVSPDGKTVAMLRGTQIVLTDAAGRDLKRLPMPSNVRVTAMAFSPDSRLLGLLYASGLGYGRSIGYVNLSTGKFQAVQDTDGEVLEITASFLQGYRLSWWTGKSALPPAWNSGVPAAQVGSSPATTSARPVPTAPAAASATAPAAAAPVPAAAAPAKTAPAGPWPSWLPTARFTFGNVSGTLDLHTPTQEDGMPGLLGTATVGGATLGAGLLVQNGLRMVALQQADGSVRACFLAKEEQRQASGVVLTAPDSEAPPVPNGETCTLTGR